MLAGDIRPARLPLLWKPHIALKPLLNRLRPMSSDQRVGFAGMLLQTERALSTPLPRIYEYDPDQQKAAPTSEPIPAAAQSLTRLSGDSRLSGAQSQEQGVRVSQLNPIALTLTRRLENEVIHPMDQWLKLHQVLNTIDCQEHSPSMQRMWDAWAICLVVVP